MASQESSQDPAVLEQMLRAENEALRKRVRELEARLREPEDIVRAIREGEVDAFVVAAPSGEQIYTLRSADLLYRGMIEDMREGAVALNEASQILYCNKHFAQLMKRDRGGLIGASVLPFVPDVSRPFFARMPTLDSGQRGELALRAADGELIPVFCTLDRISLDGNEVFCLIVTDLTNQRRREQLQAESQRKDEFLAMLAHELRNPLAPIRNAAKILRLMAPADPQLQRARGVIERQVTQLARLVDDLLDVSRIRGGKIRLDREPVDLASVISFAVETARPLIEERNHQLELDVPAEPMLVEGDAARLSQVIANLLNNAAKFTPRRGFIRVEVQRELGEARIAVRDSGVGISEEMAPRLFDLFTQAEATLGRSQGGLGIGLTLVRTLIEMHGGSVEVRSDGIGKGSEFVVRLPLLAANALPTGNRSEPTTAGQPVPRRVLVVDDNVDIADTFKMLIECSGHDVRMVTDGDSALREARDFRPEVMFLDIGLPGRDGYEISHELRQMPELDGLVLIAVTGYGQPEDRSRSREAGFDHHWVKPIDFDELDKLWRTLATERRGSSPVRED
jgi:signal transduction histidine kinase/ActR/RegA family two-component response regulator